MTTLQIEEDGPHAAGYLVTYKDGYLGCLWKGSCEPTPKVVRDLTACWQDRMPDAMGEILTGIGDPDSEVVVDLLMLVAFVQWCQIESRRLTGLADEDERKESLRVLEGWCSKFDSLPEMIKAKALGFAHPHNPFNPGNCPEPDVPVVLTDVDGPEPWRVHRTGNLDVVGYGDDQYAALEDLEKMESP